MIAATGFAAALALLPAAAAPATPVPDVPDPALCTIEPISQDRLNDAINTALAATPPPGRGDVAPDGVPASPEQSAGITTTVRQLVACYSAGELLRSYALYTDPYLHRLFARQGPYSEPVYASLATPLPAPADERVAILDISDVRVLPDGRLAANVTLRYQVIPMPKRFLMTFVPRNDSWAIDDILGEISFSVP